VVFGNVFEAGVETFGRVEAPELLAGSDEMEVGEMDEFHRFIPMNWVATNPIANG
jgi:hypothetical protein